MITFDELLVWVGVAIFLGFAFILGCCIALILLPTKKN